MKIADHETCQRDRAGRPPLREVFCVMLLFASMGAITWAIRGTDGWSGIDGTIVPGMTWGILWWYVCWRKGIDARQVPLWLGLGIALGGELGYGQYVGWIRGMFQAGDEVVPVAPWIGWAWFGICGIGWAAPGGIALGWVLSGRKTLAVWLARLVVPVGAALVARQCVRAWPGLFFPNWDLAVYVAELGRAIDPAATSGTQRTMIAAWLASLLLGGIAWLAVTKVSRLGPIAWGAAFGAAAAAGALLLVVAEWLFFPEDQLGLFAAELGGHVGRTVYTNSQNMIVVGWWVGALGVAALGRDRRTLFAGLVLGAGFGVGFPLSAIWCLGYVYAPELVDWWKMWELNSGFYLGLLYAAVLYWAIRKTDGARDASGENHSSTYRQWCETISAAGGAFLMIHVMAREEFLVVGILLGLFYVVAMFWTMHYADQVTDRQRGVSLVYAVFLLVFIMAWGASSRTGVLLGLYDAEAVDQYAWPWPRIWIFLPAGILIAGAAFFTTSQAIRNPRVGMPPRTGAQRVNARLVDLMAFTGVVGAASIWPSKIGVLYAVFLAFALCAFSRLKCGRCDEERPEGGPRQAGRWLA